LYRYFYVLLENEISSHKTLENTLRVLGLAADIEKDNKYGRSNLINNTYLIVLTGFIQSKLYTSEYSKSAFSVSWLHSNNLGKTNPTRFKDIHNSLFKNNKMVDNCNRSHSNDDPLGNIHNLFNHCGI
jgi:hypothetical protein